MKGKKRAGGGATKISGNPNVFKAADERKNGGKVKRAIGGAVEGKTIGRMTGGAVRPRLDRPGRKSGGRVGSNLSPLSTAHSSTAAPSTPKTEEGGVS